MIQLSNEDYAALCWERDTLIVEVAELRETLKKVSTLVLGIKDVLLTKPARTKFRIDVRMKAGPVEWAPLTRPWEGSQPLQLFDTPLAAVDWLDGAYPTWSLQRFRIVEVNVAQS
jgi:hypothetical protein